MYHNFFLSATNEVHTTLDYLIGTKMQVIFMDQADLQQELSELMVGAPSGAYLVASCCRSLLQQHHHCHQVKALISTIQGQHTPHYQRNLTATDIPCNDSSEPVLIHLRNTTWRKNKLQQNQQPWVKPQCSIQKNHGRRANREKKKYLIKTQTQHCIKNK